MKIISKHMLVLCCAFFCLPFYAIGGVAYIPGLSELPQSLSCFLAAVERVRPDVYRVQINNFGGPYLITDVTAGWTSNIVCGTCFDMSNGCELVVHPNGTEMRLGVSVRERIGREDSVLEIRFGERGWVLDGEVAVDSRTDRTEPFALPFTNIWGSELNRWLWYRAENLVASSCRLQQEAVKIRKWAEDHPNLVEGLGEALVATGICRVAFSLPSRSTKCGSAVVVECEIGDCSMGRKILGLNKHVGERLQTCCRFDGYGKLLFAEMRVLDGKSGSGRGVAYQYDEDGVLAVGWRDSLSHLLLVRKADRYEYLQDLVRVDEFLNERIENSTKTLRHD